MSLLTQYNNLLKCINEDIAAGIITKDDKLKVIRKRKRIGTEYNPIIDYYYNSNIPAPGYEVMQVSDVLKEIMIELMKMR